MVLHTDVTLSGWAKVETQLGEVSEFLQNMHVNASANVGMQSELTHFLNRVMSQRSVILPLISRC